jgi:hypothetical protein
MNTLKKLELKAKGWEEKEIRRAEEILDRAEAQDVFFSRLVFWTAIIVIVFANLMVSLVLVPVLTFFSPIALYSILTVLALCIGFVYNFLIMDVKHLETKHHVIAGMLLPAIALANLAAVVYFSNRMIEKSNLATVEHNPWVIGIVFAVVFILPSLFGKIRRAMRLRKRAVLVR